MRRIEKILSSVTDYLEKKNRTGLGSNLFRPSKEIRIKSGMYIVSIQSVV